MFPALGRVARMILGTPASSAASERVFSDANLLITDRRSCLAPESIDDILFLHDFLKKFGEKVLSLLSVPPPPDFDDIQPAN